MCFFLHTYIKIVYKIYADIMGLGLYVDIMYVYLYTSIYNIYILYDYIINICVCMNNLYRLYG